jgi:membrane protein YdbS with pleckstrin-like domain
VLLAVVLGAWWPAARTVLVAATAAALLVTVAAEPWYQRRRYRAFSYRLGADALEIAQGVWWKRRLVLPYHRLQRVDLHQGPLERWRGLTALRLHTASPATDAVLPGVSEADAAVLRATLLDRAGRDDGV